MSIERKLTEAFQGRASELKVPAELDERVHGLYRQHITDTERSKGKMKKKPLAQKIALVALVFAVVCGFAYASGKLVLEWGDDDGRVSMEIRSDEGMNLDDSVVRQVVDKARQVRNELAPGERALLYSADLAKSDHPMYRQYPFIPVTNPLLDRDLSSWKAKVQAQVPDALWPLGDKLSFVAGKEEGFYGQVIIFDKLGKLMDRLEEKAEGAGESTAWTKLSAEESEPLWPSYSSLYRTASQQEIAVSIEVYDEAVSIKGLTSGSSQFEQLDINGQKGYYAKIPQSLLTETGAAQEVTWSVTGNDQTFVYKVCTDSLDVPKEELLNVAKSMK